MSKVDTSDIQKAVLVDIERARESGRDAAKPASADEILKLLEQLLARERVEGSKLFKVDFSATTAQLREILATEMLKVLQEVPGFVAPNLGKPPSPDDVKQLLKTLQGFEKDGSLQKSDAFAKAQGTPEGARDSLFTQQDGAPSTKAWGQFVQAPTTAQGARPSEGLTREGLREGQAPHELLGREIPGQQAAEPLTAAGLRSPLRTGDPFGGLNNKQKLDIMSAAFGKELASALKDAGVRDPVALLKAAVLPESRAALAKELGVSRGQLTAFLARAELLSIGPGRSGEQALRPQHLPALMKANIVTQTQLATVHTLPKEAFQQAFQEIRESFSGFAKAMSGERPILKKDLQHWAKSASRKKSSILDADWEELPRGGGDAEEVIMAWYLEHWAELEAKQDEQKRRSFEEERARAAEETTLALPETTYDPERSDGLICFWIERPNLDWERKALTELVYVCLDPKTGLIDMKQKE